jgi:hypothetical protein
MPMLWASSQPCSKFCPKLPKTLPKLAKIYPKIIYLRNFEMPPKTTILVFLKNKKSNE